MAQVRPRFNACLPQIDKYIQLAGRCLWPRLYLPGACLRCAPSWPDADRSQAWQSSYGSFLATRFLLGCTESAYIPGVCGLCAAVAFADCSTLTQAACTLSRLGVRLRDCSSRKYTDVPEQTPRAKLLLVRALGRARIKTRLTGHWAGVTVFFVGVRSFRHGSSSSELTLFCRTCQRQRRPTSSPTASVSANVPIQSE